MRTRQFFVSGFALFAMFFGAGNLIFPPFLGKSGGEDWVIGFLCFFLVEVLSCVGIYAAIHGGGSVQAMNKSVGAKPGVILNTAAILCTGVGMSVAGLIMQQLCSNKFVSPTTGATISSAQFGILLALLFMPSSTLWSRALFAFACAILGTWVFVWFIQRIQFKDVVMVPLVGIMFGNVIGGITNYLSYKYEMTQAMSSWLVGHFSIVLSGNYELVWLSVPLVVLAFVFANHFNIVGMGKDFSKNLGVPYNLVLFLGLSIAAMITASVVVVVGSISYIGLIVPNIVAMFKGDKIRGTLVDTALFGAIFVLVCDMIARVVIAPY